MAKRGAFYSYGDTRLGQGRENAKTFLSENVDIAAELDTLVRDRHGLPVVLEPKAKVATAAGNGRVEEDVLLSEAA